MMEPCRTRACADAMPISKAEVKQAGRRPDELHTRSRFWFACKSDAAMTMAVLARSRYKRQAHMGR